MMVLTKKYISCFIWNVPRGIYKQSYVDRFKLNSPDGGSYPMIRDGSSLKNNLLLFHSELGVLHQPICV